MASTDPNVSILGKDYHEACCRVVNLEKMWEQEVKDWDEDSSTDKTEKPVWSRLGLDVALAVARGYEEVALEIPPLLAASNPGAEVPEFENCSPSDLWYMSCKVLQSRYPFIRIKAADVEGGEAKAALGGLQEMTLQQEEELRQQYETKRFGRERFEKKILNEEPTPTGQTLHQAFVEYKEAIKGQYREHDGKLSQWGKVQQKEIQFLKEQLNDISLAHVTTEQIESWIDHLRKRPMRIGTDDAENLVEFLRRKVQA